MLDQRRGNAEAAIGLRDDQLCDPDDMHPFSLTAGYLPLTGKDMADEALFVVDESTYANRGTRRVDGVWQDLAFQSSGSHADAIVAGCPKAVVR